MFVANPRLKPVAVAAPVARPLAITMADDGDRKRKQPDDDNDKWADDDERSGLRKHRKQFANTMRVFLR